MKYVIKNPIQLYMNEAGEFCATFDEAKRFVTWQAAADFFSHTAHKNKFHRIEETYTIKKDA